jgi:hypothetical protein
LKSKSRGRGQGRAVTVYKKDGAAAVQNDAMLTLCPMAKKLAVSLLGQFPLSARERQDLVPPSEHDRHIYGFNDGKCCRKRHEVGTCAVARG